MTMRARVLLGLTAALAVSAASWGQGERKGESSARARALKFLREHVIGKTVASGDTVFKYAGNKVEGVASGSDSFTNLVETPDGFKFDQLSVSKLTNYDLDKNGKRIQPGRNEDGLYLSRYQLTERRSTGHLVGTNRIISSTHKTYTAGYTAAVLMEVREGGIQTREHSIFYDDFFAAKGKWKPGASEGRLRFSLKGSKLRVEGENLQFDVDPQTLKKTRTADPPMKWVSNQVD
jgi:hypothetical protein